MRGIVLDTFIYGSVEPVIMNIKHPMEAVIHCAIGLCIQMWRPWLVYSEINRNRGKLYILHEIVYPN